MQFRQKLTAALTAMLLGTTAQADVLPSWRDGAARTQVIEFVSAVSTTGSKDFVPAAERIAVFDNDGTLWAEQPIYFQLAFTLDQLKEMAADNPQWQTQQPFKAALDGDMQTLAAAGKRGFMELLMATHAGQTQAEFAQAASSWISTAQHPQKKRPYGSLVYQPMLELLEYLRANGFSTYIVSGGGIEFMRPWTESVYGIPPQQVVGSSIKTEFSLGDGTPVLNRLPEINFVDDGPGKPVGINQHIGRRPIAAFGNSDGDLQMLQYTCLRQARTLCMYVHHTDAEREWAYDSPSHIGQLKEGLKQAETHNWSVVDMKKDWRLVFPEQAID